jgi:putative SOS response-associated peptidase YedK
VGGRLVVTDGFYERLKLEDGGKQPYRIVAKDREPFGLAGLWERWKPGGDTDPIETFTIITTAPQRRLRAHPQPHAGRDRADRL